MVCRFVLPNALVLDVCKGLRRCVIVGHDVMVSVFPGDIPADRLSASSIERHPTLWVVFPCGLQDTESLECVWRLHGP